MLKLSIWLSLCACWKASAFWVATFMEPVWGRPATRCRYSMAWMVPVLMRSVIAPS